mgnify:CR=1 FL=1
MKSGTWAFPALEQNRLGVWLIKQSTIEVRENLPCT